MRWEGTGGTRSSKVAVGGVGAVAARGGLSADPNPSAMTHTIVAGPRVASLIALLEREWHGDPWHGGSMWSLLDAFPPERVDERPIPGAHSAHEIARHIAAWTGEVRRRIRGGAPSLPEEGDWPDPGTGADAWMATRQAIRAAQSALVDALREFPDERLGGIVGDGRDAPLGTGVSFEDMLLGLVQHDAYHAGQIGLLARAAR